MPFFTNCMGRFNCQLTIYPTSGVLCPYCFIFPFQSSIFDSTAVSRRVLATGGEDGGVIFRSLQSGITSDLFQLPRFGSPRKKGLFKKWEQRIVAIDDRTFITTTDYDLLRWHFENGDMNWVVIFSRSTAFTPCSSWKLGLLVAFCSILRRLFFFTQQTIHYYILLYATVLSSKA